MGQREDERAWSRDSWQTLVRRLAGVGVVLVSYNPKDHFEQRSAEYITAGPSAFKSRFAIPLSLRELAAYASVCTVAIARDSGPMHVMAATVGAAGRSRVLGLVSVMNPATWRPLSERFEAMGRWPLPLTECVTPQDTAVRAAEMAQRGVTVTPRMKPDSAPASGEGPWGVRGDLIVMNALLWVARAGRAGQPTPEVHLYLYDRYSRLAAHYQRRRNHAKAARLRAKAGAHYKRSGHTGPPFAGAMALAGPRPPFFTWAVAKDQDSRGPHDAA